MKLLSVLRRACAVSGRQILQRQIADRMVQIQDHVSNRHADVIGAVCSCRRRTGDSGSENRFPARSPTR